MVISGVNARELPLSELSRNDLRELGKNLSENNISFKEIAELSKSKPDISVEQAVKEFWRSQKTKGQQQRRSCMLVQSTMKKATVLV
uniref:hypothetical protein n=1 Tax=Serratia entomophila TaxID=42906 RepID=UPI001F4C29C4|nr:hypothetical protein [Serratia entomophila]